ncbi:hypothetical protein [Sphingomonas bacterium]|uniref:hypothetical protein n=1 Tax=Sphingomonas bacterium TaxID=1895847 RepID=UPI001575F9C4|nr:hypothetical protein [Sphingomonas bacterium]
MLIHLLQLMAAGVLWFFETDVVARALALVIWMVVSGMLSIPAARRLFGQPERTDDLLFAAWLLTLNRLLFSVQALVHNDTFGDVARWTGIGAALFYAYVLSSYVWPERE